MPNTADSTAEKPASQDKIVLAEDHHLHDRMVVEQEWLKGELVKHRVTIDCIDGCESYTQETLPW